MCCSIMHAQPQCRQSCGVCARENTLTLKCMAGAWTSGHLSVDLLLCLTHAFSKASKTYMPNIGQVVACSGMVGTRMYCRILGYLTLANYATSTGVNSGFSPGRYKTRGWALFGTSIIFATTSRNLLKAWRQLSRKGLGSTESVGKGHKLYWSPPQTPN